MKILLISPSYYPEANANFFPLGLAYISAYVKTQGHTVVGLNLNNINAANREVALRENIESNGIDIIGISGLTVAFNEIDKLIKIIRKLCDKTPIVLGGGITAVEGDLMMRTLRPDYAVVGEGEFIFSRLLKALEDNEYVGKIAGIWYWEGDNPKFTGEGESPKYLDDLPLPDLDALGIKNHVQIQGPQGQYSNHLTRIDVGRSFPISASRSCPFKCTFCHHAGMGAYKKHDIVKVVDQIESYINEYGVTNFSIYDELFSANKQRVVDFCTLLKTRNINIKWYCQLRMDQIDLPMLQMMKAAGCNYISFGIESGSDTVLGSMQKKITKQIIADAVKIVREAKIGIQANFLFGDPAETEETLQESIQFQEGLQLHFCDWSAVVPYAGTPIYNHAVSKGLIPDREAFMRSLCNISGFLYKDQVNLTQMTDEKYKEWYIYLRELNDINHRKRCTTIVSGKILDKWLSEVIVSCPCCSHELTLSLHFPFDRTNGVPNLNGAVGVQGVNILCSECGRKMHLKAKDIPHIAVIYQRFQEQLDDIKSRGEKITALPALDRFASVFLEDIQIDNDFVEEVFDTRAFREDKEFLGRNTKLITADDYQVFSDKTVVILPWIEYKKVLNAIEDAGVKTKNILCWNTMFS